jgi:hypothetical protein
MVEQKDGRTAGLVFCCTIFVVWRCVALHYGNKNKGQGQDKETPHKAVFDFGEKVRVQVRRQSVHGTTGKQRTTARLAQLPYAKQPGPYVQR